MKTVILAGGLGTRLAEETERKPKPMVDIGGHPMLWHIMQCYARAGFNEFVIALGYRSEVIKRHFLEYHQVRCGLSVHLGTGEVELHPAEIEDWLVHLVETGTDTQTGGRLKRLEPWISDDTFMMTYGDGLASVDIAALVDFHRSHGRLATVLAARPPARFGGLAFDGPIVTEFVEKPQLGEGWINGGFFVLEPEVLEYIDGDLTSWEREPLERLAKDRQLVAFHHEGFWQCMDTLRDLRYLNSLCEPGPPPWQVSHDRGR